jgi:thymidylate synthase
LGLDPYWSDLIRILQIYFSSDDQRIESLRRGMSFQRYGPYISSRAGREAK